MSLSRNAAIALTLALFAAAPMAHAADAAVHSDAKVAAQTGKTADHKDGVVHHVKKATRKTVKTVNKAPAKSKADVSADGSVKAE